VNQISTIMSVLRCVPFQRELRKRNKGSPYLPRYFIFSGVELLSLILCIVLDISEYMVAVLMIPLIGDTLDIAGIVACLLIFHWIGFVSVFELVPGADILPIFIITWLAWYFLKKTRKKGKIKKNRNN
jgi:hypothetical protein